MVSSIAFFKISRSSKISFFEISKIPNSFLQFLLRNLFNCEHSSNGNNFNIFFCPHEKPSKIIMRQLEVTS